MNLYMKLVCIVYGKLIASLASHLTKLEEVVEGWNFLKPVFDNYEYAILKLQSKFRQDYLAVPRGLVSLIRSVLLGVSLHKTGCKSVGAKDVA